MRKAEERMCRRYTTALQHNCHSRLAAVEKGETREAALCRVSGVEGRLVRMGETRGWGGGKAEGKRERERWTLKRERDGGNWRGVGHFREPWDLAAV